MRIAHILHKKHTAPYSCSAFPNRSTTFLPEYMLIYADARLSIISSGRAADCKKAYFAYVPRDANGISEMEKPIDFWLRKGKAVGETKPTERPEGRAEGTTKKSAVKRFFSIKIAVINELVLPEY